ncbi:related to ornithine aminotransferase [Rhynchosporium agropyri]|uniref:Related to ornithine aminotransferase n=1 Tax=Rhynchosporium agropyri TaxID=914238 RepID=A0A1E1K8D4_9HELO|nr:related to ornithine aminotransferase [Rhynchosporium agropyri]
MAPSAAINTPLGEVGPSATLKIMPQSSSQSLSKPAEPSLFHRTLLNKPHTVESATGIYLHLSDGRKILDGCGGAVVACIGHGNQEITAAVVSQMQKISYVHTQTYTTSAAEDLATFLLNDPSSTFSHGLQKAYFVGSGSEANDSAMKLARQYFYEKGELSRTIFVSRRQSYHGSTIGSMSISGHVARKIQFDGALTLPNVTHVAPAYAYQYMFADETETEYSARLVRELDKEFLRLGPQNVVAFFAETVVGATTGCVPPPKGYFAGVRAVCDKYGILLVLDEVMCGMGRTGTTFAFEQEDIVPDMVIIGKGLGGGYAPIAGVLIGQVVVEVLRSGTAAFNHGHTYQAHPVSCAAALAVQTIIRRDNLVAQCQESGHALETMLRSRLGSCKYVGDIRGRGLLWGVEFVKDKESRKSFPRELRFGLRLQQQVFEMGVALYPGSATVDGIEGDHILISPPYNVSVSELETIVDTLERAYLSLEKMVDGREKSQF